MSSIQIVIDCHASHWDRLNYLFLGLPMLINLLVFWYWSNIVLPNLDKNSETFENPDKVCRSFIWITEIYMIILEISAISKRLKSYFSDFSRVLNILTPIIVLINAASTENIDETYFWTI